MVLLADLASIISDLIKHQNSNSIKFGTKEQAILVQVFI